jgi:hypothetical protein
MKITKTLEGSGYICDYENCGKEITWPYTRFVLNEKDYCKDHYIKLRLVGHEHNLEYKYFGFGSGGACIWKHCVWNINICDYGELKNLSDYNVPEYELFKTIYENQDLLDLLVEKLKERK